MTEQKTASSQPLMAHLLELRNRLLRVFIAVLVIFAILFPFSEALYLYISEPLRAFLPSASTMIATEITSPFLTPFKLTLVSAMFVSMPYTLYQLWAFVAPALYQQEKKIAVPLFCASVILFYTGMAFAYYLVFHQCGARGDQRYAGYSCLLRFCFKTLYGLWFKLSNTYSRGDSVLDRHSKPQQTRQKETLCVCTMLCYRHAFDTARYYFSGAISHSYVVII